MKKANALSEKENYDLQIRKKAQEKLAHAKSSSAPLKDKKKDELIHELQVHQIELEMQNDELKKAHIAQEEIKERFIDLYDFAPVGYFTFSREGLIKEVNLRGAELLWSPRQKLIGHGFGTFVVPSDFDIWNNHLLLSLLKDGEKQSCELELKSEDGSTIFVRMDSVRIEKKDGALQVRSAVSDITERKRAEAELAQLIEREQKARAEVEAARKLAHMKSMFIAATSHELRTPLNSIIGFTSLTIDGIFGELKPEQKKHLLLVHSSGKHLLSLINDILDLSMIESGTIMAVVSEFNLKQVVDEAATTLQVILNETKFELKVDVSDIKMISDRTRLLQCLIHLIGNAIKFTEKGSVEITAKVIGKNLEISVIDTGIGIKPEDIPKLFCPFVRLETRLTAKVSGTGLGLYLVKIIAKDVLGGDVEMESEFGKGSKFTLRVPVELERKA